MADKPGSSQENVDIITLPTCWKGTTRFRLFVSHIAKDKHQATFIKNALEYYGISCFVAHEDIRPTQQWLGEIEKALNVMDGMLAVHTAGYSQSIWCQQEVGFALGRDVKIISIRNGEDPVGFISKDQAITQDGKEPGVVAAEINDLLYADDRTRDKLGEAQSLQPPNIPTYSMPPEVARLFLLQRQIDFEAAGPKHDVPGFIFKGIHIESRWGVHSELDEMKRIVERLPPIAAEGIKSIWYDSKADATYSIVLKQHVPADIVREQLSHTIKSVLGGHNGVFFDGADDIEPLDPDWDEPY